MSVVRVHLNSEAVSLQKQQSHKEATSFPKIKVNTVSAEGLLLTAAVTAGDQGYVGWKQTTIHQNEERCEVLLVSMINWMLEFSSSEDLLMITKYRISQRKKEWASWIQDVINLIFKSGTIMILLPLFKLISDHKERM